MAVSFQCMTKFTTIKKIKNKKNFKKKKKKKEKKACDKVRIHFLLWYPPLPYAKNFFKKFLGKS